MVTLINLLNMTQNFSISDNFTIYLYISELDAIIENYVDSTIGRINLAGLKLWISVIEQLL